MMLSHKGKPKRSPSKAGNTDQVLRQVRTRDMGGQSSTHQFTRAVLDKMEAAA
jgi:isocitrate/isopropylmalate dehydrogenase